MPDAGTNRGSGIGGPATALLIIDVQSGLFAQSTPIFQAGSLLATVNSLADRARDTGAPVVYVQHTNDSRLAQGTTGWQLHPELRPQAADHRVNKSHSNAFEETGLANLLESLGVGRVVVTGLVTHGCVKATCLGALALGYAVVLVQDGHSSYSKDAARLIQEWNDKLGKSGARLQPAQAVAFA